MFRNYLKVAIRNLLKQKGLSFINILGLSVGLACFSLFMLYALNEFTFDSFHKNSKQIFRVYEWNEAKEGEPAAGMSYNPMPLGPAMKADFSDVENYVRFKETWGESFVKLDNKISREEISFADPSFFSVFSFKLKEGNNSHVLKEPNNIILTESTAQKLFGKEDAVGKTIQIKIFDKFEPFVVTGISENIPSNSSIQYKILANFKYLEISQSQKDKLNNWHQISIQTFVELKAGSTLPFDENRLIAFRKKYYPDEEAKSRADGWTGKGPRNKYRLQPIQNIHTNTRIYGGTIPPVDPKTIWILLSIATGVLLIACINFTTLSIGRSAGRSKEIGVRKVIGGTKKTLIFQFLMESFVLAAISCFLGLLLANLLLPYFNNLSGRELVFSLTQFPQLTWLVLLLVLIAALLAGAYPAIILSGFKPVEVLKMKIKLAGSNFFTKSLVTIQFIVSAALIISTLVILNQLHFMQSKNPGFNKENVLVIDASGLENTKRLYGLLKTKLNSVPGIIGTASAELSIGEGEGWSESGFKYNGKDRLVYEFFIDHDYMNVLGMKLIAGRNFDLS
ncbi:MAG: ABC transporter permease, partial [Flavisolibacter sp.]